MKNRRRESLGRTQAVIVHGTKIVSVQSSPDIFMRVHKSEMGVDRGWEEFYLVSREAEAGR
jgi:hypothetical protein